MTASSGLMVRPHGSHRSSPSRVTLKSAVYPRSRSELISSTTVERFTRQNLGVRSDAFVVKTPSPRAFAARSDGGAGFADTDGAVHGDIARVLVSSSR